MSEKFESEKFRLFKRYYENIFRPKNIVIPDTKFRHFRFEIFSGRSNFRRVRDIIATRRKLWDILVKHVPRNAYFTPVKWLNPIYVGKTRTELDVMLSSPLYFDIDMNKLANPTFSEAKRTTRKLLDFIYEMFGRQADIVAFSGKRGFHVYYFDWDTKDIIKIRPVLRILKFRENRAKLLNILGKKDIVVDSQITMDPFRILRIPNTLHGDSGLIANVVHGELDTFNPADESLVFARDYYSEIFDTNLELFRL